MLMELVYKLLCNGDLMLAKLLRSKVLGKHEHRRMNQVDIIAKPLAALDISSRYAIFTHENRAQNQTLVHSLYYTEVCSELSQPFSMSLRCGNIAIAVRFDW